MPSFDFAGTLSLDREPDRFTGTAQPAPKSPRVRNDIALIQLHDELWRITRADGGVLGYVERFADPLGPRFRSKRLIALQKRFVALGDFWSFDDAVDCLRFG